MTNLSKSSRIRGAIYALACGDYLGLPVEFHAKAQVYEFFDNQQVVPVKMKVRGVQSLGYYTDDTSMMLCLAESLLEKGFDTKDQFRRYKKWAKEGYLSADGKRQFGIGQNTYRKLLNQNPDDIPTEIKSNEREGGNGALMRCLPIGIIYSDDIEEIVDKSILSALVTHNITIAVWTTVVFNVYVSYALSGIDRSNFFSKLEKEQFYLKVPREIKTVLERISTLKESELKVTGYSLNTLEVALYCFFHTNSLKDAISLSILQGGDTDTQGAVTGGLSGAYYGFDAIPDEWVKYLLRKDVFERIIIGMVNNSTK